MPQMPLKDLVSTYTKRKLVLDPTFYSGRGNNRDDLNPTILEDVYTGVKAEYGDRAAKSFVGMVSLMTTDASATTFLVALQNLHREHWVLRERIVPGSSMSAATDAIAVARDIDTAAEHLLMASFFSRSKPSHGEGMSIIGDFIRNHRDDLTNPTDPMWDYSGFGLLRGPK